MENVKSLINDARIQHEHSLVQSFSSNKQKLYQQIRSLSTSRNIPKLVHLDGIFESDPVQQPDLFNAFFNSVFVKSPHLSPDSGKSNDLANNAPINFTESEVFEILCSLDISKAHGSDGIGPPILKYCSTILTVPLTHLFNICVQSSMIPQEWKLHHITPVFKSGDATSV